MEELNSYTCPCCGAPLFFNERNQSLHCNSCDSDFSVETMEQLKEAEKAVKGESRYDWSTYEPRHFDEEESKGLVSYSCPSCGAEITGDDTMGSTICPYCGNANIVKKTFEGSLKPDYIIPFKIDKNRAVELFEADTKKKLFLPDEFRDKKRIEEMTGLYVPFWMFDCECDASVTYNAHRVHMWTDSKYDYVKTDYYKLFRSGSVGFVNIPVDGSRKAEDEYMDALEPFHYDDAVNFNTGYLSGFLSDKYDVSADESIQRANRRVKQSTEEIFKDTTGMYEMVIPEFSNIQVSEGKVRYSLLPVWMLNIKYNNEMYKYAINGQTGKVVGKYPVDDRKKRKYFIKKLLTFFIPTTALMAAVLYFLG